MKTLQNPRVTKARKQHTCNFCGEKIIVGEKYMKSTHVYEGEIYDWKTHRYCSKLAHRLDMYEECDEGVTQYDFMECISEEHCNILFNQLPETGYKDIKSQLLCVKFRDKLWFVIRHYNKLDKEK